MQSTTSHGVQRGPLKAWGFDAWKQPCSTRSAPAAASPPPAAAPLPGRGVPPGVLPSRRGVPPGDPAAPAEASGQRCRCRSVDCSLSSAAAKRCAGWFRLLLMMQIWSLRPVMRCRTGAHALLQRVCSSLHSALISESPDAAEPVSAASSAAAAAGPNAADSVASCFCSRRMRFSDPCGSIHDTT